MSRVAQKAAGRQGEAERLLLSLIEAEPERVVPQCRHFGECGGCQLQHVSHRTQLQAKQQAVTTVLHRAGVSDIPQPQCHAAQPYGYRNRVRMRLVGTAMGYSRRASNEFLPVTECPILSPLLWQTVAALQHLVQSGQAHWPKGTASVELFSNGDESALQLSVLLNATVQSADRGAPAALRLLAEQLQTHVPQLVGAGLLASVQPDAALSRRVREAARVEIARWGVGSLLYTVGDIACRVSRGAFFQVNRFLTEVMQRLVTDGRSGPLAWDLYAGAGLFSVPLSRHFRSVVAVEVGEPAATDLQHALHVCGPQHRAVHSTTTDFLQRTWQGQPPDLVVLDPPRAGLGPAAARQLAKAGAAEIVYVSCDAETFARDARTLVDSGYTLTALHLLDLFPQTFHTETVAVFRR